MSNFSKILLSFLIVSQRLRALALAATALSSSAVLAAPAAGASDVAATLPIEEMAAQSDLVVLGHVVRNTARWVGKVIVTTSQVVPVEVIKGKLSGEPIEVSFIGGTVGVINQHATHQATLEQGELAVIFLNDVGKGTPFEPSTKRIGSERGKVTLLPPGYSELRLKHDLRLREVIRQITHRVARGG